MSEELLYTQEDMDEWVRTCEELQEKVKEQEETIEQLSEHKRLEEQGLIVRLPCKAGDTVFSICRDEYGNYTIKEDEVWHFTVIDKVYITTDYFEDGEFEVDVFLTRAEAEKKLKELKGEE